MATTITRPTRTDDTGTPATPNDDGDIIDAGTFTELEDNIDTMWSGATQVFGGVITAESAGTHTFSAGTAAGNMISVRNTTDAAGSFARVKLGNSAADDVTQINALAPSFATSGENTADGSAFVGTRAGGVTLAATHASGTVRVMAAGTTKVATFDGDTVSLAAPAAGAYALSGVLSGSVNTTQQSTAADTVDTALHTFTVPAGALATDGQALRITAAGQFANNANTKTVRIWAGAITTGTQLISIASDALYSGGGWRLEVLFVRTGAATQKAIGHATLREFVAGGPEFKSESSYTAPTETLSGAFDLIVSGQNGTASAGEIDAELSMVEFLP